VVRTIPPSSHSLCACISNCSLFAFLDPEQYQISTQMMIRARTKGKKNAPSCMTVRSLKKVSWKVSVRVGRTDSAIVEEWDVLVVEVERTFLICAERL
jgi:hypothetical protein